MGWKPLKGNAVNGKLKCSGSYMLTWEKIQYSEVSDYTSYFVFVVNYK